MKRKQALLESNLPGMRPVDEVNLLGLWLRCEPNLLYPLCL